MAVTVGESSRWEHVVTAVCAAAMHACLDGDRGNTKQSRTNTDHDNKYREKCAMNGGAHGGGETRRKAYDEETGMPIQREAGEGEGGGGGGGITTLEDIATAAKESQEARAALGRDAGAVRRLASLLRWCADQHGECATERCARETARCLRNLAAAREEDAHVVGANLASSGVAAVLLELAVHDDDRECGVLALQALANMCLCSGASQRALVWRLAFPERIGAIVSVSTQSMQHAHERREAHAKCENENGGNGYTKSDGTTMTMHPPHTPTTSGRWLAPLCTLARCCLDEREAAEAFVRSDEGVAILRQCAAALQDGTQGVAAVDAMQALFVRIAVHHAQISKLFAALGRGDERDEEGAAPTTATTKTTTQSAPSASRRIRTHTSASMPSRSRAAAGAAAAGGGVVRRLREARDAAEKLHASRRGFSSTQLMFLEMILEGLNEARYESCSPAPPLLQLMLSIPSLPCCSCFATSCA